MPKENSQGRLSIRKLKRRETTNFKKLTAKLLKRPRNKVGKISKIQTNLNEYSIVPTNEMQKKMDYFFQSYNNTFMYNKHMDFSTKTDWRQVTRFLFTKNKEVFRNSLKSINNELYLELGKLSKHMAKNEQIKDPGHTQTGLNLQESLPKSIHSDHASSQNDSQGLGQVTENDTESSVSSQEVCKSFTKKDSNRGYGRQLTNIEDLLQALKDKKEKKRNQSLAPKDSFNDFLYQNFNYCKKRQPRKTREGRRSIITGLKPQLIPHFEPVRINSSMDSRNNISLRISDKSCTLPKDYRKMHTSLGQNDTKQKKKSLKIPNLFQRNYDSDLASPARPLEQTPKEALRNRSKQFNFLRKSTLFCANSKDCNRTRQRVFSTGEGSPIKIEPLHKNMQFQYAKNPNPKNVCNPKILHRKKPRSTLTSKLSLLKISKPSKLRISKIKTYLSSTCDTLHQKAPSRSSLKAASAKKPAKEAKRSFALDEIADVAVFSAGK
ncbi:unnamed protein product [Moneuplotes crassus]|uniref:Uncharacterized protein n=1 Tax=Euplotes crassus TaxID=5936 RepID=A0AAD1Y707_EUPCR|nr:unnamed protein product [Moneuplotes crassus]